MIFAALLSAGAYIAAKRAQNEEVDWGNAIGWGAIGAGIGLLPDIIEPANGPAHRASAHSLAAGGTVLYAAKTTWDSTTANSEQKAGFAALTAAYLSHLIADSDTPAGLPII